MSGRDLPSRRYFVDSQHGGYPTYYNDGTYRRDPYEDRLLSGLGRERDIFGTSTRDRSGVGGLGDRYGGSSSLLDPADRFTQSSHRSERNYGGDLWAPSGGSSVRPPTSRYSNTLGRDTFNPYSRIGYNELFERGVGVLIPRNPAMRPQIPGSGRATLEGTASTYDPYGTSSRNHAVGSGIGRAGMDDYQPVDGRSRSHRQVDDIIRDPARRTPGGCMGFGGYKSDYDDYSSGGGGYGGGGSMYGGGYDGGGGWGFY